MSRSLNAHRIIGHVGQDPEIRVTANGTRVAHFSIATNRSWKQADGTKMEETDWHQIVAWGKLADIAEHLGKGSRVYVEGESRKRVWEEKWYTEVHVNDIIIIDGWRNGGGDSQEQGGEVPRRKVKTNAPKQKKTATRRPSSRSERTRDPDDDLPFAPMRLLDGGLLW